MLSQAMPTDGKGTLIGAILELGEQRRTGVLQVRAEDVTTSIVFDGGAPIDASEQGTPGEPLGRMLVRTHALSSEQHAKVIDAMASSLGDGKVQKFGEAAITLGILTAEKLEQALKEQVRWRMVRALQRDGAEWSFVEDDTQVLGTRHHELSLDSIVLDASRWFSDARRRAVVEGREPFFVSLRGSANAVARRFGMTPEEQTALEAFDGTETVEDLVSVEQSATAVDVSALLVALLSSGVVELSDSPRLPGPHPPRASLRPQSASSTSAGNGPASQPPRANDRIARTVARLRKAQAQLPANPPLERRPQNEREARVFAEQSFQHGQAHLRANRLQQAVPLLRRAFGLMPKNLEYELYAMWTEVRVRHEKPTPAQLSALRNIAVSAIRQDPNLAFAYYVLGHVTLIEGSEVMAKRHFSHALRLDPEAIDAERHIRVLKRREAKGASRVPQLMRSRPPPPMAPPVPNDRASGQAVARVALKKAAVDASGGVVAVADPRAEPESFVLYDKVQKTLELPADMTTPLPGQLAPIEVSGSAPTTTPATEPATETVTAPAARRATTEGSPLPDGPSSLTAVSRVANADRASPMPAKLSPAKPPVTKRPASRASLYTGAFMMGSVLLAAFVMVALRANRAPPPEPPRAAVHTPMSPPSAAPTSPPPGAVASAPTASPPPSSVASAPAPAPAPAPVAATKSKEGTVVLPKWAAQRRVYVDGKLQGNGPNQLVVACGSREIRVGSSGQPKTLQVPCGGTVDW